MSKPFIIGITGGSGSGKTTFIKKITEAFSKEQVCIISQDDYYRPIDEQFVDNQGVENFDLPTSIDEAAFVNDVKKLISGEVITKEEYCFNNDKSTAKTLTFQPAPVIIVEGLFIFYYQKMMELLDLKVFIDAKENLKVIRRIKRDRVERNYPLDDVLYRYQYHVLPAFEKYIEPYRNDCDLIINNNENFDRGLEVMTGFLRDYLGKNHHI